MDTEDTLCRMDYGLLLGCDDVFFVIENEETPGKAELIYLGRTKCET